MEEHQRKARMDPENEEGKSFSNKISSWKQRDKDLRKKEVLFIDKIEIASHFLSEGNMKLAESLKSKIMIAISVASALVDPANQKLNYINEKR